MSDTELSHSKIFVRHDPLPPVCGPDCQAYGLKERECKIFKVSRLSRQKCLDKNLTTEKINNLLNNTDIAEVKRVVS